MRVSARKFETEIYKFIQIRLQIWTQNDKARYREMILGLCGKISAKIERVVHRAEILQTP